jgi:ATP-dependent RNA helicase DbpA
MNAEFRSLPLSQPLLDVVAGLGYTQLTPIQQQSIPVLLEGRDLVGQSQTGSGKTAAFSLPILQRLTLETRALKALVLCPTRELSAQVAREVRKLGSKLPGLQVLVVAGGEPLRPQANALEKGVHIVVGTPGRVLDHLGRGTLDLSEAATVVLDEADRMLDMGFADDMQQILEALPRERQTVFFSATFPSSIEALSRQYQRDPVRVTIAADRDDTQITQQLVLRVEPERKLQALRWALQRYPHESAIVFANFKATVAELEKALANAGTSVSSLHGDLEQFDRDRVMAKFRNQSTRVLVATDVAARGIDIENLDLVINYELPAQPEIYVHRIGRTGRAGKTGIALSFASEREQNKIKSIELHTGVRLERTTMAAPAPLDGDAADETPPAQDLERAAKMDTLRIAGGRKQKMRPGDILGALTGEAGGLSGSDIGKIEIHDNFSYVAVSKSVSRLAQQSLSNGKIKGKKFVVSLIK